MRKILFIIALLTSFSTYAQQGGGHGKGQGGGNPKDDQASIEGHVFDARTKDPIAFASIGIKGTSIGTVTDREGDFILRKLQPGTYTLVITFVGYERYEQEVRVVRNRPVHAHIELKETKVMMDEVVISASRIETSKKEAPVIVNVMSEKTFQQTNAQDLSQALPFQSGVRVEYSCQNCGFSQVRINGMDGPYSQILIDSKPIMSALGGVYGLEQMPVNMVERIEVIKGAGSALYGSNAIAGTINIITKEPLTPSYSIGTDLQAVGMKAYAQNFNANAVVIGKNNKSGASFYQTFRKKSPYDHDDDGFSEIGKLDAFSFGTRSFYKLSNTQKLTLEYHTMQETRRGGNAFEQPPHLSDITEMTDHKIHSGGLNYDYISLDGNNKYSVYSSAQYIDRESYFGSNKDPKAYGRSNDMTFLLGTQGYNKIEKLIFLPASIVYGIEYSTNSLEDSIVCYNTGTKQSTNVIGAFLQSEWTAKYFRFVVGGRLDKHNLIKAPIFSPRLNIMYTPSEDLQVRASYGSGYRAPQAYDEDLHVTQVGGQSLRTKLDPNLRPEYSHSFSLSSDYYVQLSDNYQANFLVEGFYTNLKDIFALKVIDSDPGSDSNTLTQLRYNASGAKIGGLSITAKLSYQAKYTLTLGYTYQQSKYNDKEKWSEEPSVEATRKMLRTPDNYAYATLNLAPVKPMNISLSGTYTGQMLVPHYAGYIPADKLETTPHFFDLNLVASYDFKLKEDLMFQIAGGIKNIFNAYQRDFDQGIDRDAGYIYGPMLPRTIFISLKLFSK
ncbi:MAG: TonB-dependent receptor [Bacteroidales bacterium]|nr:TonB-dependent receptor [Bacteroidales bacterium]